jgi:hypothetical protein
MCRRRAVAGMGHSWLKAMAIIGFSRRAWRRRAKGRLESADRSRDLLLYALTRSSYGTSARAEAHRWAHPPALRRRHLVRPLITDQARSPLATSAATTIETFLGSWTSQSLSPARNAQTLDNMIQVHAATGGCQSARNGLCGVGFQEVKAPYSGSLEWPWFSQGHGAQSSRSTASQLEGVTPA